MLNNKQLIWLIIILGILLRVVVMVTTYHPDIRATEFVSWDIVENGHLLTFYDTLHRIAANNPLSRSLGHDEVNYPPLAYLAPTLTRVILRPVFDTSVDWTMLTHVDPLFGKPQLMWQLFLLKLPNLVADLAVAYFLTFFVKQERQKIFIFALWLFNPLTLYASFAMGQHDIWPVLTTVLAALFLTRNRPVLSVLFLGLGGGYKLFPLLLLIPTALLYGRNFWEKSKLLAIGLGVYFLIIAPFLLTSPGFRSTALLASQTDKILFSKINVSGDQYLSLFAIGYFVIALISFYADKANWPVIWTAVLLLLFAVTNYHPQWFLWLTPWLFLYLVKDRKLKPLVVLIFLFDLAITLSFDPSLHFGLFAPVLPGIQNIPYNPAPILQRFMPFSEIVSLVRSALAGAFIVFLCRILPPKSGIQT